MNEKFKNLIILPKHIYLELKKQIEIEQKISKIDRNLRNILHNKKYSDDEKWHLYKRELVNHINHLKVNNTNNKKNNDDQPTKKKQ